MMTEIKSALISAVVGGAVAFSFQLYGESRMLEKTARVETVLAYANTESPITPFAARYMAAITGEGDLRTAQYELRGKVADEMDRTEKLKHVFSEATPAIERYLTALDMFAQSIDDATDATKMKVWSERFGHVVDTRMALERSLLSAAGV